jgi:hypothetical protein
VLKTAASCSTLGLVVVVETAPGRGLEIVGEQSLIPAYVRSSYDETGAGVGAGALAQTSSPCSMRLRVGSRMAEMVAADVSSLGTVADSALSPE